MQERLTDGTSPIFPLVEGEDADMLAQREARRNREFSLKPPPQYFPTFASPVCTTFVLFSVGRLMVHLPVRSFALRCQ
jgi:hypothetical protein